MILLIPLKKILAFATLRSGGIVISGGMISLHSYLKAIASSRYTRDKSDGDSVEERKRKVCLCSNSF